MQKITIQHVSRIEGHAKVSIFLNEDGRVARTHLHVTQVRGFEKFTEGRPFYEMPAITSRICGICPVSHALASAKACDAIMAVQVPEAGQLLRELLHCAQFVQSHALSFFHLSAPDLLLGLDSDPALRNIAGLLEKYPDAARDGIALRKFGQRAIEALAGERIHASWVVPGGVNKPASAAARDQILAEISEAKAIADRTLAGFRGILDRFAEEIEHFGNGPTMYAGLVDPAGCTNFYEGGLRFVNPDGSMAADHVPARQYADYIAEAAVATSYLKAPYYKPIGYPSGAYRVGPLARVNVADRFGSPRADAELAEFRQRFGRIAQSAFLYHYARLMEVVFALERMEALLNDARLMDTHVRARAAVNSPEGVGMIEAPRGVLIHHYKVNDDGTIRWANLIVATGHNNLAMDRSVEQVSRHFIDGQKLQEGMLNRVSAVIRAFDPCLSCSTHATGTVPLRIQLVAADGSILDELKN
jgi:NAD-reducing hydrogenase large subunit